VTVTIDRSGLSNKKYEEVLSIIYYVNEEPREDRINLFINGVVDKEGHNYGIVEIGTQTWMAENLNSGTQNFWYSGSRPTDNGMPEKFCYGDLAINCDFYGGLYYWEEMMDYTLPDTGFVGTTQGVCPNGWHIPTKKEFETLIDYLGGKDVAGGHLKDTSSLWISPNEGATNQSGFGAIPGGLINCVSNIDCDEIDYVNLRQASVFWTASFDLENPQGRYDVVFGFDEDRALIRQAMYDITAASIRCIKDP
jgi:uncharacterized protein (TIGR02145 family)